MKYKTHIWMAAILSTILLVVACYATVVDSHSMFWPQGAALGNVLFYALVTVVAVGGLLSISLLLSRRAWLYFIPLGAALFALLRLLHLIS